MDADVLCMLNDGVQLVFEDVLELPESWWVFEQV